MSDSQNTFTEHTSEHLGRSEYKTYLHRNIAKYAAVMAGVGVLAFGTQDKAEAGRGYAASSNPSLAEIYEMGKQQVFAINPSANFAEPNDLIYNTKNVVMGCSTGQETFKKAVIKILKDRRTVKVRLTTRNNTSYSPINEVGSADGKTPTYMTPMQCDEATRFDATLELGIKKYDKSSKKMIWPKKMAGKLARKAIPRHEVYLDKSKSWIGVKPEEHSWTDTITLRAPRKITNQELRSNQLFVSYYTQRAQRGVVAKELPAAVAEIRYLRPINTMKKTNRYNTVADNWWSPRIQVRSSLLKSIDRLPVVTKK